MANILICDDEKDIVNALKIYISNPDFTIFEAYDGKEYYVVFENPEPKKFKEYQMKKN